MKKDVRRQTVELPKGFIPKLRSALHLSENEKPRVSYLSLANDVARVQKIWADGSHDPKSQKATYAGMFFELVDFLGAEGQLFSVKDTQPLENQPVRIECLDTGDNQVLLKQIVERIQGFRPHLLIVSPSISPDIVPLVAGDFATVYYGHSLLWPSRWDGPEARLSELFKRWVRRQRYAKQLKDVAGLLAASDVCRQQFRGIVGSSCPEVSVLRQFVHAAEVRRKNAMRNLLFVGGMDDWSGVRDLVSSFEKLRELHPKLTLTLIGDGPLRDEFEAKAKTIEGLSFASGFDAQIQQEQVLNADLLVVSEPADTLIATPTFLPEALVCGTPALVSSTVPLAKAESVGCAVYRADDYGDLEKQILNLYENEGAYRELCAKLPLDDAPYRDASQSWGSGIAQIFGKIAGIR